MCVIAAQVRALKRPNMRPLTHTNKHKSPTLHPQNPPLTPSNPPPLAGGPWGVGCRGRPKGGGGINNTAQAILIIKSSTPDSNKRSYGIHYFKVLVQIHYSHRAPSPETQVFKKILQSHLEFKTKVPRNQALLAPYSGGRNLIFFLSAQIMAKYSLYNRIKLAPPHIS